MPNSAQIRKRPGRYLYQLKLEFDGTEDAPHTVLLRATLTDEAKQLGVRFDESQEDDIFNLSAKIGNNNGQYHWGGIQFQRGAKKICIKVPDYGSRVLLADLMDMRGLLNKEMPFNLDDYIGLVDYFHPLKNETYFRLGLKPEPIKERSLVLCFDGTSNHFSHQNTNVVKLVELLKKDDPERQMVYYQTGVGTYVSPGWVNSLGEGLAKTLDEGIAWYLHQHIMDGYKYLMETYRAGDRICIFGFSRGAFTARALAGMIHCVGLLPRHNIEHIPFAYQLYANSLDENKTVKAPETLGALETGNPDPRKLNPEDYKKTFCISVKIDFVGVWDTVASVGALMPKFLPWIDYNPSIRVFRHALALDERRANFVPSLWNHSLTDLQSQDVREVWFKGQHCDIGGGADEPEDKKKKDGVPPDPSRLSNIPLRWMVRQCIEADTIVVYDHQAMDKYRDRAKVLESNKIREEMIAKQKLQSKQEERLMKEEELIALSAGELAERHLQNGSETQRTPKAQKWMSRDRVKEARRGAFVESARLDKEDIVYKPFDAMKKHPSWHLLEYWPLPRRIPTESGYEITHWPHFHTARAVYFKMRPTFPITNKYSRKLSPIHLDSSEHPIRIHASVVDYLNNIPDYTPRAIWHNLPKDTIPYVEDAVPTDKLPLHDRPEGADADKPIGKWSEQAKAGLHREQDEAPGIFSSIVSSVWG